MAEHDSAQERTEQATPKRQDDARARGQIARSRELTTACVLFGGVAAIALGGPAICVALTDGLRAGLTVERSALGAEVALDRYFIAYLLNALWALAPVLVAGFLVAGLGPLALGGWNLAAEAALPKFERIDPWRGVLRIVGSHGAIELLKASAKFILIAVLTVIALRLEFGRLLMLDDGSVGHGLAAGIDVLWRVFLIVGSATLLLAAIDVPVTLWQHNRALRMSRQELREESKETEGAPEQRSRIRALQQEVARRRMLQDVPKADVIITNPEHYAVALRFDAKTMRAPILVAKGVDQVALNIRAVASAHGITELSAPPLARAIYHTTKLSREIPAGLYVAVARVLAYVFQLRAGNAVVAPAELPIPPELTY